MKKKSKYLLLIFFALFLPGTRIVYGQQAITGTVHSRGTQVPIVGATVKLESGLLSAPEVIITDSAGRFVLSRLSPGDYKITASMEGFYPESIMLTLTPRAVQPIDFGLQAGAVVNEAIDVVADRLLLDEAQGSSLSVIDPAFKNRLPLARKTSLPDLVSAFVPSAVASHDNFVHLRGNELSLNTSINGVSFIDNPHQYFAPGIDPGVIQSFSVITGGFPAEYGNRFGGIIDAVTRSGFDTDGHGAITVGASTFLRNTVSAEYGGRSGKFGYFLYGAGFESLRFINPPQPRQLHDFGKGVRTFAQFDYRATANDTFRLLLANSGSNFEIPNRAEEQGRDLFQRSREQTAIFTWEHSISTDSLLVTSLFERLAGTRLLGTSDPLSIQAQGLRNDLTVGARSDYTRIIGSRHTIKAGLELTLYRLREDFSFDPRENDFEVPAFDFRGRRTGGEIGLYLQDRVAISKNFIANLGLRYDKYSLLTSEQQVSPRINLVYTIRPQSTAIHFAYNRLFAPPPIENLLLTTNLAEGGKAPRSVKSNLYEIGVSQSIKDRLLVRVTTFLRDDKNSFELTELANVRQFLPTTFANGRSYGIEFSAQLPEIPRLGLSGYFNYTAQRAFQIGPISGGFADEEVEPGERNPAAFDQIHTGTAGIMWQESRSGFWSSIAFEYGSGTPSENRRLPQHLVVNVYAGIDLFSREKRKVSLQFNVENATNRVYGIAKESEFTPVQFSTPRYYSGAVRFTF